MKSIPDAIATYKVPEAIFDPIDPRMIGVEATGILVLKWLAFDSPVLGIIDFDDDDWHHDYTLLRDGFRNFDGTLTFIAPGYYCERCKTTFFVSDTKELEHHDCSQKEV